MQSAQRSLHILVVEVSRRRMHENADFSAVLRDLSEVSGSLKALLSDRNCALLLGEGGRVTLEPFLLPGSSVSCLVPELYDGGTSAPGASDTSAEGGSLQDFVAFDYFPLIQAPSDSKCEELLFLDCVGNLWRFSP